MEKRVHYLSTSHMINSRVTEPFYLLTGDVPRAPRVRDMAGRIYIHTFQIPVHKYIHSIDLRSTRHPRLGRFGSECQPDWLRSGGDCNCTGRSERAPLSSGLFRRDGERLQFYSFLFFLGTLTSRNVSNQCSPPSV